MALGYHLYTSKLSMSQLRLLSNALCEAMLIRIDYPNGVSLGPYGHKQLK